MSIKDWALYWANGGFRIFPITPNAKKPPIFKHFGGRATTHQEAVEDWWTENPMYNIGIVMDGLVCVDGDLYKNPNAITDLALHGIDPDKTLSQKTARGGKHLIYTSTQQYRSKPGVRHGIDIKSGPDAYILGAGSGTPDGVYLLIKGIEFIQPLPADMAAILEPWGPAEQAAAAVKQLATKIDDPVSIMAYRNYCNTAPPAVQGQHGDHQTFIVAAMGVKDYALSPYTTFNIMLEHFNPRCIPKWDKSELRTKVLNGYEYGSHPVGGLAPNLMFASVRTRKVGLYPEPTRAIDWLVTELLIPGEVTVLAGASGVGKSSLMATIVAHMISGHSMGPFELKTPAAVITLNTEDVAWISHNRIGSVFAHYGWPIDEKASANVLVLDKEDSADEPLAMKERGGRIILNQRFEERIEQWLRDLPQAKALFLDALPNLHEGKENDNDDMAQVMGVFNRLASKYDLAILIAHHAGKGETNVRGASSILGRPRLAYTVELHETKANTIILKQVKKTHGAHMEAYDLKRELAAMVEHGPVWPVTVFGETATASAEIERVKYLTELARWMNASGATMVSEAAAGQHLVNTFPGMTFNQFRRRGSEPGKLHRWLAGRPQSIPLAKIDGTTLLVTVQLGEKGIVLV